MRGLGTRRMTPASIHAVAVRPYGRGSPAFGARAVDWAALCSLCLFACESPPPEDGLYDIIVIGIEANTCAGAGVDHPAVEVTDIRNVAVTRYDGQEGFGVQQDGGPVVPFTLDGVSFVGRDSQRDNRGEPCIIVADHSIEGRFLSRVEATSATFVYVTTEGDCAAVDTTWTPCAYTLQEEWARVSDLVPY